MRALASLALWFAVLAAPAQAKGAALASHDLIFVQAQAGGHAGAFLVDTGAPVTVLDAAFAAQAGLRLGADQVLQGGGGARAGRIAEDVVLTAAGGPALRLDPAVADLSEVARGLGRPVAGILGGDYFAVQVVSLDYRTGEARFADPREFAPPPGAAPLIIHSTPYVHAVAEVGGRRAEGLFQIDSGSNLAAAFFTPYARRHFPGVRGAPGRSLGVAGPARSRLAVMDRLELAGRRLEGLVADLANDTHPDDASPGYAGAIGGGAFAGRVLHLDYSRQRMWLD